MKIINLVQGSPEWLAHRRNHFNASDAPAMMGASPYKTRAQLLREMVSGMAKEVSAETQRLFDAGHRFEDLARPRAEKIIGQDLYPLTGTEGRYSASFDGLTDGIDGPLIAFEHKSASSSLREAIRQQGGSANEFLAPHYRIQMEHQCMVSGAEKVLFMASKWSDDGELIEERHCWYLPDPELRKQIVMGWQQFEADLLAYQPEPTEQPKPEGKAPDSLPALRIEVSGEVTKSNLVEFKATALGAIRSVNKDLQTDQDFADAEKAVKWCEDVESRLEAAKQHALSQTASIDELFRTMDDIGAEARRVRLDLEKLVKARKESIKVELLKASSDALAKHFDALNARLGERYMPSLIGYADFGGVIKGKRSVQSMRDALDAELARSKIAANELADKIQANMQALVDVGDKASFPDAAQLVHKAPDDLAAIIAQRVADQERRLAAAAEAAERSRQEQARIQSEQAAAKAQIIPQVSVASSVGSEQPASIGQVAGSSPARQATQADDGERIRLGEINSRIAPLSITADGLKSMGFEPAGRDRAGVLYRACDFRAMVKAMVGSLEKSALREPIEVAA